MTVGFRLIGAAVALALVAACHSGAGSSAAVGGGPSCLAASSGALAASSGAPGGSSGAGSSGGPDGAAGASGGVAGGPGGSARVPAGSAGGSAGSVAGGGPVPDVALDCFSGSGKARLTDLHAPAIVTLWASWCVPCAKEMPAFQSVADKAQGRVRVIGVVTFDAHDHAQAFIDEHKVSFTMLDDPDKHLLVAVGRAGLPVTLFLTADGRIAHLYNGTALDEPTLESMTATYLGAAA